MSRRLDFPWTAAVAALAVLATAGALVAGPWNEPAAALVADRAAVAGGQLWRLFTGPLVHGTFGHLLRDVAVFVLLGAVFERELRGWPVLLALSLVVPTAAVLALDGRVDAYLGLSGAVNAQLGAGFVQALRTERRPPLWLSALFAGWLAKLAYEATTGGLLLSMELGEGIRPTPIAHLAGAVVGLGFAGVLALRTTFRGGAKNASVVVVACRSE